MRLQAQRVPVLVERHVGGDVATSLLVPDPTDAAVADVLWRWLDDQRVVPRDLGSKVCAEVDDDVRVLECRALALLVGHRGKGYATVNDSGPQQPRDVAHRLALSGWLDLAACAGADTDLFFMSKGQAPLQANRLCARCPVVAQCLSDSLLADALLQGAQAGLTTSARHRLRRLTGHVASGEVAWWLPAGVEHTAKLVQVWRAPRLERPAAPVSWAVQSPRAA